MSAWVVRVVDVTFVFDNGYDNELHGALERDLALLRRGGERSRLLSDVGGDRYADPVERVIHYIDKD